MGIVSKIESSFAGVNNWTRAGYLRVSNGKLIFTGNCKATRAPFDGIWRDESTGAFKQYVVATGTNSELDKVCIALAALLSGIADSTHSKWEKSSETIAKMGKKIEAKRKQDGHWLVTSETHSKTNDIDKLAKEVSGVARKLFVELSAHLSPRGYFTPLQNGKRDGCLWANTRHNRAEIDRALNKKGSKRTGAKA